MSEPQLPREVRRRLAIIQHAEEVTGNVAMTCRYYGISRQVYYRWLRRYREQGVDGLRDLSRRPHNSPNATHVDVVGKILYLRQNYHFGPDKIAMYLKRYHDVEISTSGVWRILKRLDLNRLPASQRYKRLDKRWQRYEKQLPGHQVQIDVKFVEPLKTAAPPAVGRRNKYYQFTAIDDCTRTRPVNPIAVQLIGEIGVGVRVRRCREIDRCCDGCGSNHRSGCWIHRIP
jgi:transposase